MFVRARSLGVAQLERWRRVVVVATVPLITFGEHCFYRKLSEHHLVDAGIDHTVAWSPGEDLPPLPAIHQVVRTVPGEALEVAAALVDAISPELLDPVPLEG